VAVPVAEGPALVLIVLAWTDELILGRSESSGARDGAEGGWMHVSPYRPAGSGLGRLSEFTLPIPLAFIGELPTALVISS
jgi:hypothetical protein